MFNIPIKESEDRLVSISKKDLYVALAVLFTYVFLDGDTASSFKLRAGAKKATEGLSKLFRMIVEKANSGKHLHLLSGVFTGSESARLLSGYGEHMIRRLIKRNRSVDDVIGEILPTAAAAVATQAQAMSQMLDLYLKPEHSHHWAEIRRCAYSDEAEDFKTLQKYALEACRLEPAAFGLMRTASQGGSIRDHEKLVEYQAGDYIWVDIVEASRDPAKFGENANEIDIDRHESDYIHQGVGPHSCLGKEMSTVALATQLGLFAKLKNLRRVEGQAGHLKYTTKLAGEMSDNVRTYLQADWSSWWPFPTSKLFCCFSLTNPFWLTYYLSAMKVLHEGLCETLAEHDMQSPSPTPESHIRADSGISIIPEIRTNGYATSPKG